MDQESLIARAPKTTPAMSAADKWKLSALMAIVLVTSTVMGILSPLVVMYFESDYFVVFMTSFEFMIIFGLLYLFVTRNKGKPRQIGLISQLGIFNAIMAMSYLYASDPTRTPPVMQSTLTGMAIVPSAIMRRCMFGKSVTYNPILITFASIFLAGSLGLAAVPVITDLHGDYVTVFWCMVYLFGVCARSWYNVIQEKYVRVTEYGAITDEHGNTVHGSLGLTFRQKLGNKFELSFYSRLIMIACILPLFGVEWIGMSENTTLLEPLIEFNSSMYVAFSSAKEGAILQGFIISYLCLFFSAIYLNGISTNYHMILTAVCNPMVGLFFTIFPQLNPGLQYPLWITLSSLGCGVISVVLWMFGEGDTAKKICRRKKRDDSCLEEK